jgi:tetratricopeptide (TPR) repeat protein
MKRRLKEFVRRRTPAFAKIWVSQFGIRTVIKSAALSIAFVSFIVLLCSLMLARMGLGLTLLATACLLIFGWYVRAFDSLGQILCSFGRVKENFSQDRDAKACFQWALLLLRHRLKAYQGLYRLVKRTKEMEDLALQIRRKEQRLSAEMAALMGHCCWAAGDLEGAKTGFEIADGLCSTDTVKLALAEVYLRSFAPDKCLQTVERLSKSDSNGHSLYLRASALSLLGKYKEALVWSIRATQVRPCDSDYQLQRGRILEALGHAGGALRQYSKAIRVHRRSPEAFFRRGLLRLKTGERTEAIRDFEECCYYENTRTEAHLFVNALRSGYSIPSSWGEQEKPALLSIRPSDFELTKGQNVSIPVMVSTKENLGDCRLEVLEAFGGGLEPNSRSIVLGEVAAGQERQVTLEIKAKRASEVNLHQPWVLNIVLIARGAWASHQLRFTVTDPKPGRAFFVLTNDHEPQIHRERIEPNRTCPVLPEEATADLVTKGRVARNLAEKYGLRWTLMLDAGTAIGLPKWAGDRSSSWKHLYREASEFYLDSFRQGHDCQIHLHLKAVPESRSFCYQFDETKDVLSLDLRAVERRFQGSKVNSWANVTPSYGRPRGINSRVGSLSYASGALEMAFSTAVDPYRPVLFRAGQWDMGRSTAEREKSVMALRECGILADSSVAEGYDCYERPFQFGLAPSQATYFTFRNNPEKRARSLVDAGILQAVPILLPQGSHAVTPRDDPRPVIRAYRSFLRGSRVAPGRHLIMEIEHFGDIPTEHEASCSRLGNGSWNSMDHHLSVVRSQCPALEGVRGTEAIYEWLDYYTPELIVRLGSPTANTGLDISCPRSLRFPLHFIGDGILGRERRVHKVRIPLPFMPSEEGMMVRVFEAGRMLLELEQSSTRGFDFELALSTSNEHDFAIEVEMNAMACSCPAGEAALSLNT